MPILQQPARCMHHSSKKLIKSVAEQVCLYPKETIALAGVSLLIGKFTYNRLTADKIEEIAAAHLKMHKEHGAIAYAGP